MLPPPITRRNKNEAAIMVGELFIKIAMNTMVSPNHNYTVKEIAGAGAPS